jgi:glycosidase
MRPTNRALLDGNYVSLNENDPDVLSYMRSYKGQNVLVVLNMRGRAHTVKLGVTAEGIRGQSAKTLLSSFSMPEKVNVGHLNIEAFGAWIGEIQ